MKLQKNHTPSTLPSQIIHRLRHSKNNKKDQGIALYIHSTTSPSETFEKQINDTNIKLSPKYIFVESR